MTYDHRIKIGSETKGLRLIKDEGRALYSVVEDIPEYQPQLRVPQNDWLGGHGQYDFRQPDMYFEGQSIDTTQEGRLLLGPLINQVGVSGGDLDANPTCFCWFSAISKWMAAAGSKVFWYDGTNFVEKVEVTGASTETLRPNAAGDETSITDQYPDSTYHWDKVDEVTADDLTTRVRNTSASTAYLRDLYNLPAHGGSGVVNFITIFFRCRASTFGGNICYAKPSLKTGGAIYDGTEIALTSSWTTYSQQYTINPNTEEAWTWDEIDALQIGVSLKRVINYPSCTQVYVEVNYATGGTLVTDLVDINDVLYVSIGSSGKYYYSTDGANYTRTDLDDGYAEKIFAAPNPAGTATVLWKFKKPNELSHTTDGTVKEGEGTGVDWSSPAYIGDTSNDITNIFLVNDNLMAGKRDNLWHYDSDGGTHPLMNDLRHNRSLTNFKYVVEWQTAVYFSLITGLGEISSYNSFNTVGALQDAMDINKAGICVGLASDKDFIYQVIFEGTNTHIYKGREITRGGALRWEWCPWVFLGTNACATAKVCQHSSTDRRLWFGYGNYAGYVILTDNPTADSAARFAPSGWIRMSYIYGTNKYWDMMFQSIVTETKGCASGKTVTPKYRKDTDTTATVLTPAIRTNGVVNTNCSNEIDCKRIQFELHLVTDADTATPEVLFFEARGIERPETVRIHEATYAIGDTPSRRTKTTRDFLRSLRDSNKLIKFADLRYGESIDKDYTYVVMQPGYPREPEMYHQKGKQPELGMLCRFQEISFIT